MFKSSSILCNYEKTSAKLVNPVEGVILPSTVAIVDIIANDVQRRKDAEQTNSKSSSNNAKLSFSL